MPVMTAKKKASVKETSRAVYPEVDVKIYVGDNALTVDQAKELIGWEEEGDEKKFGSDYMLTDEDGKKVRCLNNTQNRPFGESWALALAQDHLRKNWRFNGETIVIGKSGQVLSGQHRLVGLILAEQQRTGKQAKHWKSYWKGPVTMECLVVFGVDEGPETTRTLDNVKPRSLADVLFCDPSMFGKNKASERATLSKMLDSAIKFLWSRTGEVEDPFSPRRTHSEALAFLDNHPRLVKAVKHIWEENQPGKDDDGKALPPPIGRYVNSGTASGVLYLMGCCGSDGDVYHNQDTRNEKKLDWGNWDQACEFFTLLGGGAKEMHEVHMAFANLCDPDGGSGKGTKDEQILVLAKAWNAFKDVGGMVPKDQVDMSDCYTTGEDGIKHLTERADFGGIDRVPAEPEVKEESEEEGATDPTPDEIEERAEQQRAKRADLAAKLAANRKAKKAATVPANGDGQAE